MTNKYVLIKMRLKGGWSMKKLYMVGLVVVLFFAVAMIGYGAWLNKSGESQIVKRMENKPFGT